MYQSIIIALPTTMVQWVAFSKHIYWCFEFSNVQPLLQLLAPPWVDQTCVTFLPSWQCDNFGDGAITAAVFGRVGRGSRNGRRRKGKRDKVTQPGEEGVCFATCWNISSVLPVSKHILRYLRAQVSPAEFPLSKEGYKLDYEFSVDFCWSLSQNDLKLWFERNYYPDKENHSYLY